MILSSIRSFQSTSSETYSVKKNEFCIVVQIMSCSFKWPHYTVPEKLGNCNNIGLLSEQETIWKLPIYPKYVSMMCLIKTSYTYKYLDT